MITIRYQDGEHQYDEDYSPITTWNEKYCGWVINEEYESSQISWGGDENGVSDFPVGGTKAEFEELCPGAENYPDIVVVWQWDQDGYLKEFGEASKSEPPVCIRSWGYLNYSEEDAIKRLGHYCGFNRYAYNTRITYNGKIIFNGKLE